MPVPQPGWHTGHSPHRSAAGNGACRWEPEAFRRDSFSSQPELILHTLAMSAANAFGFELQKFVEQEWWQWRSRTYRALGCLQRQQGNLPQRNKTWKMSWEVTSIIKQLECKYLCMLCALGWAGSLAWYRVRNSPVRSHRQGQCSAYVLWFCVVPAWLKAC